MHRTLALELSLEFCVAFGPDFTGLTARPSDEPLLRCTESDFMHESCTYIRTQVIVRRVESTTKTTSDIPEYVLVTRSNCSCHRSESEML